MGIDGLDDDEIRDMLTRTRRIALVGASARPHRPSFGMMGFLLGQGFDVTPADPGLAGQQIQQRLVVATLAREAGPWGAMDRCPAIEWTRLQRRRRHA